MNSDKWSNHKLYLWHAVVHALHDMQFASTQNNVEEKSRKQTPNHCQIKKNYLVYSEKFSQQKPWKCKNQNPKGNNNHTTLPTVGGGLPSKLGDIYLPVTFWESPWITLLTAIARYQNPQLIWKHCSVSLCGSKDFIQQFSRGSQLPPSTPWSIFFEKKCLRSSASLWCHSGGTVMQLSVFQEVATSLTRTMQKYPSCQPLSILHWSFAFIKTSEAASRKDIAAEMQRHVFPLCRHTKTWLANSRNTCKPSPRVERGQQSYRFLSVRNKYE